MKTEIARATYACCPLCSGEQLVDLREEDCSHYPLDVQDLPGTILWRGCERCGHVFTSGYFQGEALERLFERTHPHQSAASDLEAGRLNAAPIVDRVSSLGGGGRGRWLEVGFGSGALLATAEEYGYEALGIDTRADSVAFLRELGYDARRADFMELEDETGFDVISMADVLEHLPFPGKALEHARQLMPRGGQLFVSAPNVDCLSWKVLDARGENPYWRELEHYHNFSREHLFWVLRRTGFEPIHYGVSPRYRATMEVVAVADDGAE